MQLRRYGNVRALATRLITKNTKDITQDTLNLLADNFLLKYPDNEHLGVIRKYIRYKLIPSNWGYAFEFFSGYGFFSGNLRNHYANNVHIGIAFDISYKNIILYLRDYIGFSYTKHDFYEQGELWPENSQVRVYLPELSLGYVIHDSKHLKLAPLVLIWILSLENLKWQWFQQVRKIAIGLLEFDIVITFHNFPNHTMDLMGICNTLQLDLEDLVVK